jgi:high-affinity K+ transport system ATPase subunit B
VLEQIAECRTAIFDKTGTLTYGEPKLTEQLIAPGFAQKEVLTLVASLERYSKHPLARAILAAAKADGIHAPGGHRGERTTRPGTARNRFRPSGADHQPQQTDRAKARGRRSASAGRRWTRVRGGD